MASLYLHGGKQGFIRHQFQTLEFRQLLGITDIEFKAETKI